MPSPQLENQSGPGEPLNLCNKRRDRSPSPTYSNVPSAESLHSPGGCEHDQLSSAVRWCRPQVSSLRTMSASPRFTTTPTDYMYQEINSLADSDIDNTLVALDLTNKVNNAIYTQSKDNEQTQSYSSSYATATTLCHTEQTTMQGPLTTTIGSLPGFPQMIPMPPIPVSVAPGFVASTQIVAIHSSQLPHMPTTRCHLGPTSPVLMMMPPPGLGSVRHVAPPTNAICVMSPPNNLANGLAIRPENIKYHNPLQKTVHRKILPMAIPGQLNIPGPPVTFNTTDSLTSPMLGFSGGWMTQTAGRPLVEPAAQLPVTESMLLPVVKPEQQATVLLSEHGASTTINQLPVNDDVKPLDIMTKRKYSSSISRIHVHKITDLFFRCLQPHHIHYVGWFCLFCQFRRVARS